MELHDTLLQYIKEAARPILEGRITIEIHGLQNKVLVDTSIRKLFRVLPEATKHQESEKRVFRADKNIT